VKAAVYHGPHDIRIESVPDPGDPEPDAVLLEVVRAAICGTDSAEWDHGPVLARPPVVLGHEFVGLVAAVGENVQDVKLGDRLVSGAGVSCGRCEWCRAGRTNLCADYYTLGLHVNGGLADLVTTPAAICRRVPSSVSDDAAAMAQPLAVALHAVRRSGVGEGHTCAVIGVGGIGGFIVAAAAARGPAQLIALDIDDQKLETARRLGAHETLNVRGKDMAQAILAATDGEGVHVVIEASGAPAAPAEAVKAVRRGGRILLVGLQAAPRELDLLSMTVREIDLTTTLAHVCSTDLPEALELLASTNLAEIMLDRVIPLDALVDKGIRSLAERTAQGKIVVNPNGT
jgi:(R,R)-butanediol dehydrogenase / meso-butanediol dehydrogenase / diacetyl reductase